MTAFIKESPRLLNTRKNICIGTMDSVFSAVEICFMKSVE